MTTVIAIENLWKEYRLGVIGHGTLIHDLQSWWARVHGKEDPNAKIAPLLKGQEKQIEGDHFWALRDINLEVKEGEVLGIIGKNGAGKSTLLKVLSRVTAPTRGCIKVKGRIASLLEVGTGFHPELTGRENIFMNGAILGMSKQEIKSKLDEIIDFSGVEYFVDTPVKRYSSGMYVRLAFAVAAHLEPEILVVDEVLAVGDAAFQKKCLGKMRQVSRKGRTILFVSHNMGAIKSLTSRCMYLANGNVVSVNDTGMIIGMYLESEEQNSTVNVEDKPRPRQEYGKEVRICRIEPLAKDGKVFLFGQDLTFLIKIKSSVNKDNLRFGITIFDLLGNVIIVSFTPEELPLSKGYKNKYEIKMADLYLAPGNYRIALSFGLGSLQKMHSNLDAVIDGPVFEVAQVGFNGSDLMKWDNSWGNIYHSQTSVNVL